MTTKKQRQNLNEKIIEEAEYNTGIRIYEHTFKEKSFHDQVECTASEKVKLKAMERWILVHILSFLLTNEKPVRLPTACLSEITKLSERTVVRALKRLEYLRLIERNGMGKNRKFKRGSILNKIIKTTKYRHSNKFNEYYCEE